MDEARSVSRHARRGLPPDVVRRLSALSPIRSTLAVFVPFALIAALFALAWRFQNAGAWIAIGLAMGTLHHHLAVVAHQAAHHRLFETRWLNDLAGRAAAWPLGVSLLTYRIIHRTHHAHLYEPVDPDLPQIAGYPRGRAYLFGKLAKDLTGVTALKNYAYFMGYQSAKRPHATADAIAIAVRRDAKRDQTAMIAFLVTLIALLVASGAWKAFLLLWVVPAATWFQMLLRLRAVCEHGAVSDTSSPFTAARTNLGPALVMWILFPLHMNFHIEHHLYPSIPHYRLPECHREMKARGLLDAPGTEAMSFFRTLAKIFAPRAA